MKIKSVKIPLCNVHPSEAASVPNGYSLSRNTRYHFTIRIRKKDAASLGKATTRSGTSGNRSGEVTVYLP